MVEHCLTLDTAEKISACRNYCSNYKLFEMSNEWEGTLDALDYTYNFVLSAARKSGFLYKKEVDQQDESPIETYSNIS